MSNIQTQPGLQLLAFLEMRSERNRLGQLVFKENFVASDVTMSNTTAKFYNLITFYLINDKEVMKFWRSFGTLETSRVSLTNHWPEAFNGTWI